MYCSVINFASRNERADRPERSQHPCASTTTAASIAIVSMKLQRLRMTARRTTMATRTLVAASPNRPRRTPLARLIRRSKVSFRSASPSQISLLLNKHNSNSSNVHCPANPYRTSAPTTKPPPPLSSASTFTHARTCSPSSHPTANASATARAPPALVSYAPSTAGV